MHNWMRPEGVETTVRRLAAHGIDCIVLEGRPDLYDRTTVAPILRESGVSCWGGVAAMEHGLSLISADDAVRASSVSYAKRVVTMVKELDGEIVTVVPGEIGNIAREKASPDDEWAWACDAMRDIHAHAVREGIRIAIEPINRCETDFINRIDQALALAEAVAPDCGVCADTFHMNIEEDDVCQAIASAAGRITDFHVSDSNQMACGMGHLDWPAVLESVSAAGYDGPLAIEFVPTIDRTPASRFPEAVEDFASGRLSEAFYSSLIERCTAVLRG